MRKLSERNISKLFLQTLNESTCLCEKCKCSPCVCTNRIDFEVDPDIPVDGASHRDLDPDNDGVISQEDLFGHFDLDNDGTVTTDEYVDHIQYHADNPETLEEYSADVPCKTSYTTCKNHYDNDNQILIDCIRNSGATCMQSGLQAMIDVLTSLKNTGII